MSRRSARACGQHVFHVLNRAIQNTTIFTDAEDYATFLALAAEASDRFSLRVLSYSVMPNHWHLVVWPTTDDGLSACMQWLTAKHAHVWRKSRGTQGRGAVYQARFKAIAVQCDRHFIVLNRYVERNAVRAHLVERAEHWPWTSASPTARFTGRPAIAEWPVARPPQWAEWLNEPDPHPWLYEIRRAIRRNQHFGDEAWREAALHQLDWRSGRGRGRPRAAVQ
jgi:putative transposase